MKLILSTAFGLVAKAAAKALKFSSKAWDVAQRVVAQAEVVYTNAPGKGEAKYQYALGLLVSQHLGISAQWAGILIELAWLLFQATGWPKGGKK